MQMEGAHDWGAKGGSREVTLGWEGPEDPAAGGRLSGIHRGSLGSKERDALFLWLP